MFDSQFLTPEVKLYLKDEEDVVGEVMARGYDQLVEVGCGYGRYLNWALSRNYKYVGLDIVPWLVELGQIRIAQAQKRYPSANARILLHPAEEIAGISEIASSAADDETLVLFPFNCLGNVSQFEAALDSLEDTNADVIVSTFKTDGAATKIRKAYYQNCGYEELNSRLMKEGLLIVSAEGFHAMAYYANWLVGAFEKRSFKLAATGESGAVGSIYYFERGKRAAGDKRDRRPYRNGSEVILYVVEERNGAETAADAELLQFRETTARLTPVEVDRLEGECRDKLAAGTSLRFALPVVSKDGNELLHAFDLVAEVLLCEPAEKDYRLVLKLSKPEPRLFEKLVE